MAYKVAWIVDSSLYFRRLESECVAKACHGCHIESLDIIEALRRFNDKEFPDVLIIDTQQPKVNGVKLVNLLKNRRPEMDIIVCSAQVRQNSKDLIGMTLISKPITSIPLYMETVKEIMGV